MGDLSQFPAHFAALAVLAVLLCLPMAEAIAGGPPNVVLIVADNPPARRLGACGSRDIATRLPPAARSYRSSS